LVKALFGEATRQPGAQLVITAAALTMLTTFKPQPNLLEQIRARGELRVVTRIAPTAFYHGAEGEPLGPEYDLVKGFADHLNVRLTIKPLHSFDEIYGAVANGRAQIAAAGLSIGPLRIPNASFGPAYQDVRQHLVYAQHEPKPQSLADIGNKRLEVATASAHAQTLRRARAQLPSLVWVEDNKAETLELLNEVAAGTLDYTIADSTEFALAAAAHPEIRVAFDFPETYRLAWVIASQDDSLLSAARDYFSRISASGELASLLDKYYGASPHLQFAGARALARHIQSRLPRFRPWFEEAARVVGEDWRLLAAIGYQESQWDAKAVSFAGARGLMQLMSVSASDARVSNRSDPRENIFGAARFLKTVRAKIPSRIPEPDRTWFTLAAYNVGFGHLEDARILTEHERRDPDSWQDVREYLPLLAQEQYYLFANNGYARGWEPVRYVDNVRAYLDILEWLAVGDGAMAKPRRDLKKTLSGAAHSSASTPPKTSGR
jgi:membrane-bound lytic murein transglycosylase F